MIVLTPLLFLLLGCGAPDGAPSPANAPPPVTCPSVPEVAPNLFALLRAGQLDGVRHLIGDRLSEHQVTAVVESLLRLLRQLDRAEIDALLALAEDPRLTGLLPLLTDLLRFVAGDPARPETLRAAELGALRSLLTTCQGDHLLSALDALLRAPELPRFLAALGGVLELPLVRQVLAERLFDDRHRLAVVLCGVLASFTRPEFDVDRNVRQPLEALGLGPADDPAIGELLRALGALLATPACPTAPICAEGDVLQPRAADLVCCAIYGATRCDQRSATDAECTENPLIRDLVFDLLVSDTLPVGDLLQTVSAVAGDPSIVATLEPVRAVLRAIAEDADLRNTLLGLVLELLSPDTARRVLPEIVLVLERDGLGELLGIVDALLLGCEPAEMAP